MVLLRHGKWSPFLVYAIQVFSLICLYFPMSIGLTFYQKSFIKMFKFPLLIVSLHYAFKWCCIALYRSCYTKCSGEERITLEWKENLCRVAPAGLAASLDIALSNWALEFITISLYTMTKSTCIVFILFFAVLLSLEKLRWSLLSIVLCIALGTFLFTYKSTQFSLTGFLICEVAAVCAGARWAVSQFLMQRKEMGLHSPVDMIYYIQPWMFITVLPLALVIEGPSVIHKLSQLYTDATLFTVFFKIILGGFIALCMEISEYWLLVTTSSLTLNICGIIKEIVTLLLAHEYKGDQFSPVNILGLFLCFCGIILHVYNKALAASEEKNAKERKSVENLTAALLKYESDSC